MLICKSKAKQKELQNMEHAKRVFIKVAEQYEDYVDMLDALRNLRTRNEITEEEFSFIIKHWNKMLEKHSL